MQKNTLIELVKGQFYMSTLLLGEAQGWPRRRRRHHDLGQDQGRRWRRHQDQGKDQYSVAIGVGISNLLRKDKLNFSPRDLGC